MQREQVGDHLSPRSFVSILSLERRKCIGRFSHHCTLFVTYACGCGVSGKAPRLPCIPGCVHVMLVQKVSWCMQRLHLQVILLLCLESAILLPLNYIRATGAHKPRQNGEPRQPRHLDTSTASTPTSTPRHHSHMESALTDLDRPRHKPRHRLDRGSTASTPRQPGLCLKRFEKFKVEP